MRWTGTVKVTPVSVIAPVSGWSSPNGSYRIARTGTDAGWLRKRGGSSLFTCVYPKASITQTNTQTGGISDADSPAVQKRASQGRFCTDFPLTVPPSQNGAGLTRRHGRVPRRTPVCVPGAPFCFPHKHDGSRKPHLWITLSEPLTHPSVIMLMSDKSFRPLFEEGSHYHHRTRAQTRLLRTL